MNPQTFDVASSVLASTARLWRGTMASPRPRGEKPELHLFDREGCIECRLVREALSELNLDAQIFPFPERGQRYLEALKAHSGSTRVPFLFNPQTDKGYAGASEIVNFLFDTYSRRNVPLPLREGLISRWMSHAATVIRGNRGVKATPSRPAEKPLTLYSFESSPYSRLVRERLTELELGYTLINLSKQQIADLGPATQRLHLGKYEPLPGSKREAFLRKHGRVQVPYLEDPNTGVSLFESTKILQYLNDQYGRA
ncbi:glutathione S-transferase N-terminal domain-containing protein [Allohahella marinimesophila]|uniref:Glutathione S-transferase N-terminal domain-containing protein n=1 Tax=Allohahella marinimesophila TaxID=1054972 RepID=A0ABP7PDA7_9GAMM